MAQSSFASALFYLDPMAALEWLERAFGFERSMLITDQEGKLVHSQMTYGNGYIMVGTEWSDDHRSPASIGGKNSQTVHVHVTGDIDAHCAKARGAGARILQDPEDQFYGDRTYRAVDPEGHIWTFAATATFVSREDAEKASGLKIEGWVEPDAWV
jgi:uncharacterized glyoxalase superfamily protein PhnB